MYTHMEHERTKAEYQEQQRRKQVTLPLRGNAIFLVLDNLNDKPGENMDKLCINFILTTTFGQINIVITLIWNNLKQDGSNHVPFIEIYGPKSIILNTTLWRCYHVKRQQC